MEQYYYLMASLPFLRFREKAPVSHSAFLEASASWLDEESMGQLRLAVVGIEDITPEAVSNGALSRWLVFENSLRTEMVKLRAAGLGLSPDAYLRRNIDADPAVFSYVREAVKETSPLRAEMALWALRWNFLEELGAGHFFDMTALIVYGLKLQILERLDMYDEEKGKKVYHSIYEGSRDDAKKHRDNNRR